MGVIKSAQTVDENTDPASWNPPSVSGPRANRRNKPTLAELEDVERAAWDEAYAKGLEAGRKAGEQEARKRMEQVTSIEAILNALAKPLQQLDREVETQLVSLVFAIAKQVVRRELRIDPAQVIAVVRDTVGLLPLAQRNVRVHLHPEDARLIRERLAEPQSERAWSIIEDPVMSRGGCRVTTDTSQIDARLETRLAAVFAHLMGDDRDAGMRDDGKGG
ncbi:MAG TPA: flagellar assembly protein FliH [Steroidobacteraceae bacterium]|nr:flagellar assembly protein FliH [Steroidobacteraceae bacterium]